MKADLPDDLRLNPKQFANLGVGSHPILDVKDLETIVKRKLTLYLTAYFLEQQLNDLQETSLIHRLSSENCN
ncbi:hypothetical protein, partial [Lacticaseibacillus rhamnosus]|uniref:hypothetical protein n=1 Tax=Lacticaseibacillus rhamnosus TaxID=47715 RepID=UPI000C7ABE92